MLYIIYTRNSPIILLGVAKIRFLMKNKEEFMDN